MKKLSLLSMGSASLLMAGAAMAAPPSGFTYNDYTVNVGVITAGACPVGYTCQTLQTDLGFLQQRVSDGTAAGTYFRTVVVADDASAADAAGVDALAFRNDTFVGASNNSGALASLGRVSLEGATGSGFSESELARGGLNTGEPDGIRLHQNQNLGDRTVDFQFNELLDGSEQLRLDQVNPVGGNYSGPMTVRRTTGSYTVCDTGTGCVLELPDGQQLTYDSGDSIGVMYQHQALFGMGSVGPGDRVFENQTFTVNGTTIGWTNVTNNMTHGGGGGILLPDPQSNGNGGASIGGVVFNTVNADGGAWDYWDDNFGTAPTGVTPPAGFPSTPFDP